MTVWSRFLGLFDLVDMQEYRFEPPDPQHPFCAPADVETWGEYMSDRRRFRRTPASPYIWFRTQAEVNAHVLRIMTE